MSEPSRVRLAARLALDVALWFAMPFVFLAIYVGHFHVAASAILPHLRYVAALLLALFVLRAVVLLLVRRAHWYRIVAAPLLAFAVLVLVLYYASVLVGLNSWSRVISWELIASYVPQIPDLAQALEISLAPVALALLLGFAALSLGIWWYLKRADWIAHVVRGLPSRMTALYLIAGGALLVLESVNFYYDNQGVLAEPFSLTMFPQAGSSGLANISLNAMQVSALDAAAAQARNAYRPNTSAQRKNVVLIVVDALRQDNMGVYGYTRDTTPFLSRAKLEGKLAAQIGMRATCAESSCGILSISSSAFVHGLSQRPFTLQEVLKRHGYVVHFILGGDHTNFYGLRELYGEVDSYYDGAHAKGYFSNDDKLVTARVDALPDWDRRPTMFHMHLMSVHGLGKRFDNQPPFQPAKSYLKHPNVHTSSAVRIHEAHRNYYDNGVRQADQVIETILTSLQRKGYLDNAVVVVTADHGEAIGEHGLFVHANGVHEPLLRVPFLLLSYGSAPPALSDVDINASQVDIAPTIAAELKIPPPANWIGMALQEKRLARFTYFQQHNEVGLIEASAPARIWKYWRNAQSGQEFAFDLKNDPEELHNQFNTINAQHKTAWRQQIMARSSKR